MCIDVCRHDDCEIVRFSASEISTADVSELRSVIRRAVDDGIPRVGLSICDCSNGAIISGILMLCGDLMDQVHGKIALIEEQLSETHRVLCSRLGIPTFCTEHEFITTVDSQVVSS